MGEKNRGKNWKTFFVLITISSSLLFGKISWGMPFAGSKADVLSAANFASGVSGEGWSKYTDADEAIKAENQARKQLVSEIVGTMCSANGSPKDKFVDRCRIKGSGDTRTYFVLSPEKVLIAWNDTTKKYINPLDMYIAGLETGVVTLAECWQRTPTGQQMDLNRCRCYLDEKGNAVVDECERYPTLYFKDNVTYTGEVEYVQDPLSVAWDLGIHVGNPEAVKDNPTGIDSRVKASWVCSKEDCGEITQVNGDWKKGWEFRISANNPKLGSFVLAPSLRQEITMADGKNWWIIQYINYRIKIFVNCESRIKNLRCNDDSNQQVCKDTCEANKACAYAMRERCVDVANVEVTPQDKVNWYSETNYGKPEGYSGFLPDCAFSGTCRKVNQLVSVVINAADWVFGIMGSVAFLFFIYGGFMMIFSLGTAERVTQGKNILVYAVIGMVVSLTAFMLVNFLLNSLGVESVFRVIK
ncbi:MAG TPA: pilin [Candidatus Magasanikbacteria bacterium]|nr:pilin [Candidatus Magasanikbacteria bacterium]